MYKIVKIEHAKRTQGLLRLCMMIPSCTYEPQESIDVCHTLLHNICNEAKNITFLRRNKQEPLESTYNICEKDDRVFIESIYGKPYLEFVIKECE